MNNAVSLIYRVGARSVLPANWHGANLRLPDSKFYYVEQGQIVVEIYGQTIVAGPGDLLLIPANVLHSCWLTEEKFAVKSWCHFSLKQGANDFFENCTVPPILSVKDPSLVADLFRQLSDPSRMRIFWILCHCEECVINLSAMMEMSSPAVSHHLKLLKSAGLIVSRREGKEVYYKAAESEKVHEMHRMMESLMEISCP